MFQATPVNGPFYRGVKNIDIRARPEHLQGGYVCSQVDIDVEAHAMSGLRMVRPLFQKGYLAATDNRVNIFLFESLRDLQQFQKNSSLA
jgi:hypothetical protein